MQKNDFWEDKEFRIIKVKEILNQKKGLPPIISVTTREKLSKAVQLMHEYNISQLPVIDNGKVVGRLDESSLMKLLHDGIAFTRQQISAVMGKSMQTLDEDTDITEVYRILLSDTTCVIVTRNEIPIGVITRVDLINYWATH